MSIHLKNLTKKYDEQLAVNNISFDVNKGEIVGFLGPNGAGKSTTMKMICGYLLPTSGTVEVCGIEVPNHPLQVKHKVGYLPESNPLYLDMYITEFLTFVAGIFKIPKPQQRIKELIDMTGLGLEQRKKIGALSKGYKQRVGIAQALMQDPEVLILDEPTSGLDPNQLTEIRSLIKSLGREKTVLLSTHIMQEVESICDRIIIINKGNIVADSPTQLLLDQKGDQIVVNVRFKNTIDQEKLAALSGIENMVKGKAANSWLISGKDEIVLKEKLLHFAVQNENLILHLSNEHISLENVFQELTHNKS